MADRNTDTSDLVNEVHVHGAGALIPEEVEKTIRYHYSASLPFKIIGRQEPLPPPTRRQRLRVKWRDFRWWLGHKVVGHECVEDDW